MPGRYIIKSLTVPRRRFAARFGQMISGKVGCAVRCSCPHCETETWMIHSERDNACVCPQCLYRCYACQGTGTALTREQILSLREESAEAQAELLRENAAEDAAGLAVSRSSSPYTDGETPDAFSPCNSFPKPV